MISEPRVQFENLGLFVIGGGDGIDDVNFGLVDENDDGEVVLVDQTKAYYPFKSAHVWHMSQFQDCAGGYGQRCARPRVALRHVPTS
jgi:hypothetical protein